MLVLSTKLKNAIVKEAAVTGIHVNVQLKNILVNTEKRGCSGFVVNSENQKCVYVNTENFFYEPLKDKTLVRYARDTKDYSSNGLKNGYNQFVITDPVVIAKKIVNMLS